MIRIKLDVLPPSINEMYKRNKTSFYKSSEAKKTMEDIQLLIRSQYRGPVLSTQGINVSVNLHIKNPRRDIDGSIKSLLDAGNGLLWKDDSLISELHVFKLTGKDTLDMVIDHSSLDAEIKPPSRGR